MRAKIALLAAIAAPRSRRFVDDDLAQARALRREPLPKPRGHVFDGWIFQAGNLVEIAVIEVLDQRSHRVADLRVIVKPSGRRIDLALDAHLHLEAVPVHPAALVS